MARWQNSGKAASQMPAEAAYLYRRVGLYSLNGNYVTVLGLIFQAMIIRWHFQVNRRLDIAAIFADVDNFQPGQP